MCVLIMTLLGKKMANRPRRSNKQLQEIHRKKHQIKVLFDDEQYSILLDKVAKSGEKHIAIFARNAILDKKIIEKDSPQNLQFLGKYIGQLGYIGNNLNQISHALNHAKKVGKLDNIDFMELNLSILKLSNDLQKLHDIVKKDSQNDC